MAFLNKRSVHVPIFILPSEGKLSSGISTGSRGLVDDKGHALALALVVKRQQANVSIRVCLLALLDLLEDLS